MASGLAAILASTCCLGPLVLLSFGISGAWIVNLTSLEPYQPIFISASAVALFMAWRRIWRPTLPCVRGGLCAVPRVRRIYKVLFGMVVVLLLITLSFPAVAPWFY